MAQGVGAPASQRRTRWASWLLSAGYVLGRLHASHSSGRSVRTQSASFTQRPLSSLVGSGGEHALGAEDALGSGGLGAAEAVTDAWGLSRDDEGHPLVTSANTTPVQSCERTHPV